MKMYNENQMIDLLEWIHRDLEMPGDSAAFIEDCLDYLRNQSGDSNGDAEIAQLRAQLAERNKIIDQLQRVNESLKSVIQDVY